MADHQQIIKAFLALSICIAVGSGCRRHTTPTTSELPAGVPGKVMVASYKETHLKYNCKAIQAIMLERSNVDHNVVTAGEKLTSNLVCASCYKRPRPVTITRRVVKNGKTLTEDRKEDEILPGTWRITAYIEVPAEAREGSYALETEIQTGADVLRSSDAFQVLRP